MPTLNIMLSTTTVQAAVVFGMLSDPVATPPIPIESAVPAMTYAASSTRFDTTGQPAYEQQHVGGIDDRCAKYHRHADRVTSKVVGVRHTSLIPAMRPMLTARSVHDDHRRCHTACAAKMIAG
jgi:hypothetical protein